MSVLDKIKNLFKGIGIFVIVYIVISGNGDDTFFAWVLMFVSLVLTMLFLDETKNKWVLSGITVILGAICFRGFVKALPWLILIAAVLLAYYYLGCNGDISEFEKKIIRILNKDDKPINMSKQKSKVETRNSHRLWSAFNILNPFERYYYVDDGAGVRILKIQKGIVPFEDSEEYSITMLMGTKREIKGKIFWCSVNIDALRCVNHEVTTVVLKHISRRKKNQLISILNGR
jgi:general stress protein CsbA